MKKIQGISFFLISLFAISFETSAQGSRTLAPNYGGTGSIGVPGAANNDFAWLEHDAFGGAVDNFLDPGAPAAERMYVYLRAGETLRYGIRRIPVRYEAGVAYGAATANPEADNQDLTLILYENDGTIVQATHMDAITTSYQDATLQNSNGAGTDGIITTVASSLIGPAFTFNSVNYNVGGYTPREYTNNTGSDQSFYISFLQDNYTFTNEAALITAINNSTIQDVDIRSWYDLWDFTVYDGNEEQEGRLYCRRWNFTSQYFENRLSDEFNLFIRVPSTVGGVDAGNYVKNLDIGGLDPFSLIVYANSEGSDGTGGDTNGDGTTDFQDNRQGQLTDIGYEEYDIFLQNPDIVVWPTTTLPSVSITNAVFYCNDTGTGGEAAITFETNQVGYAAIIVDLNGIGGYQYGTTDVLIEAEIATIGSQTIQWNGLDGLGASVPNGTPITISGRFTSGPIHVPMYDVEESAVGINMLDVRPSTSFDLIYWDDTYLEGQGDDTGAVPLAELDGTNSSPHLWDDNGGDNGGDERLVNTWSFGYYQINTENTFFTYTCDEDGDGITGSADLDSDNDGVANSVEGDIYSDADADGIPDYVDSDFAGFVDSNGDGVNDNFDADLDGVPNALDIDSDNDGIPDLVENGLLDTDFDGRIDGGITDANSNGLDDTYDPDCDGSPITGYATAETIATNVGGYGAVPQNAIGATNNGYSIMNNTSLLVLDLGRTVVNGTTITITWGTDDVDNELTVDQGTSSTGPFTNPLIDDFGPGDELIPQNDPYTLTSDARYLRFRMTTYSSSFSGVDAVTYTYSICSGGAALTVRDTDGDGIDDYLDLDSDNDGIVDVVEAGGSANPLTGQIADYEDENGNGFNDEQEEIVLDFPDTDGDGAIPDYLDIDSDNDGILDNREAQASQNYIASAAGDTDGDGLLDVYDPDNGGTFLSPVDTDSDGTDDFQSQDSDGDGVSDNIEGWDANRDGFSDLDTDIDRSISDETGYNVDADSDGLWDIYESSAAPVQNSDGAGARDWQDDDDDNDGILTSGEDANNNGNWDDDYTQGQGGSATVPDYLFRGDYDGDAVADAADADSDNDGILDTDEANGESIDPSGDEDGDGIPNYQDQSDATVTSGLSSTADANGDGVYDVYDSDRDGVPDFLDLDSDNDGIWDAIEADGGSVPNGLNTTTGQFALQDPDNDGLMNYVDTDDVTTGGTSDLANPDSDGDGIKDYVDIDSDGDGITDIIEAQTLTGFIGISGVDADGDGIDDAFDVTEGGVLLDPVNSDELDLRDYLDSDSDNDGVLDVAEGDDQDQDGYGDWDLNSNNVADDTGMSTDTDGDGLVDFFDTVTLGSAGNETGSNADLPNTDGIDNRNWRDSDDDNDGIPTEDEDANSDGNFANDQTGGQSGSVPDFLFHGDFDGDGIPDLSDGDSDNDGILDVDEDGGTGIDPSADADGDGIPNYKDSDLAGFTDTNGDGIDDRFDQDGDGTPDFRDRDSDNDGMPDIVEAGGTDVDGDGEIDGNTDTDGDGIPDNVDVDQTGGTDDDGDGIDDNFDASETAGTDTDGDGILDTGDLDIDGDGVLNTIDPDNGGTALITVDSDGDGLEDHLDLDSDNDGIPDLIEAGGTDADGDGKLDDLTDTDLDGFPDVIDSDNGGTALTIPDTDGDLIPDYLDVDSDNDGIPDPVDNGGADTNNDGRIDGFATDTDGDGLADAVDPDNGGTPIANVDTDGDGIADFRDLDADNDGYQDILEAGGVDADNDGIVDTIVDTDGDGIPDSADVDSIGGGDADGDGISNTADVDITGGNDDDGDGIDNAFDPDKDGNGFDDEAEANPYGQEDKEGDGFKDFRDLDSDGDGITDTEEFGGLTVDAATGRIASFTDANSNGWNDAQESTPITPANFDGDSYANYQDIDSDNDGLPDNIEAQTKATYVAISGNDTDSDGLDDVYDPDNGGSLVVLPNTDATGNEDYLDTDADGDTVPDNIEGANDDRSQYADWDTNNNNDVTDEVGYTTDTDSDGLLDVYDLVASNDASNVTGSVANGQDIDVDGIWDFQDVDDDADAENTIDEDDDTVDNDPTNDFADGGTPIPDYLYGNPDADGDGINDDVDADADNDGVANTSEEGGTGIDPAGDVDGDGILNAYDADLDGDGIPNDVDPDADASGSTDTIRLTDKNGDGIADQFDKDLDGVPGFRDLDSDNDGIADIVEFGLTDADEDGTLDEGSGITDLNGNGHDDNYDPTCTPCGGVTGTAITLADTDSDGISNHLDLDSDNDGLPDNIEAQPTIGYVTPVAGDANMNGILDVYDGPGNALDPENTDGDGSDDYIDSDSDGDSVPDYVEAFDANMDGFSNLDTDRDGLINDQKLFAFDIDKDGIRQIFDTNKGRGTIINITATNAVRQDSDDDGIEDWRDDDDDNDGILTISEDTSDGAGGGADGIWSNDFVQGGASVPDYLYNPDNDGDGILNQYDLDPDNDGISIMEESNGTLPFGDEDGDGLFNYLDSDYTGFTDSNGDGVDDRVDRDRDGVPNFYDLDSDDDGISDIIEAGLTDGNSEATLDEGSGITDANNNGVDDSVDDNCAATGNATWIFDETSVGSPLNALGGIDGSSATFNNAADLLILDMGQTLTGGTVITVTATIGGINQLRLEQSTNGSTTSNTVTFTTVATTYTLSGPARFIHVTSPTPSVSLDALTYSDSQCTGGTPPTITDTDSDGLDNYLDIDSDNDGISDNREGQPTAGFTLLTNVDTDGDGLKDAFDGNNGGTAIVPQNSDGTGDPDYLDQDSDDDGVEDFIEGYDANRNGFSELDVDRDGDLSDETGYGIDTDGDGLWNIFDSYSGTGVSNGNSTYADLQDNDGDGTLDFRDDDDDNDGIPTSGEDNNTNGDWWDDKTQGGGATPDYLYFNDTDGDGVADGVDQDADNDGLSNDQEHNTAFDPFGDNDADGVFNYADTNDPGLTGLNDSNSDGIWDEYDYDLDGFPNFFDLDNDNDGIPDAVEANGGTLPATANNQGQFPAASTDADNDGWFDTYDTSGASGGTNLSNPDSDGDGLNDIYDRDSDNDGITDLVEAGGNDFNGDGILDSYGDTDGDGIGNNVDSDNGGTALSVPNTNGTGGPDYLDINSESDDQYDWQEGFDDDEDLEFYDDYEVRRASYESANGSPGHYPTTDTGPANGRPDYLDDHDGDGTPNFLDPQNATYYRDSDNDGIVDFFDPSNNGTWYGSISGIPDNDDDGITNVLDSDDSPLPLDWISFKATFSAGKVHLEWQTANEVDVSHFDIEHSVDGINFRVIGQLPAYNNDQGINNYGFVHHSPIHGINYYRLNQVDFDGASDYSKVRVVSTESGQMELEAFPNPTSDFVTLKMGASITGTLQIIDLTGRRIFMKQVLGTNEEKLDLSSLKAGMYYLRVDTPVSTKTLRIIKK